MLIAGNKNWSADKNIKEKYSEIWLALTRLPPPKRGNYVDIVANEDNTVLCLEKEIVYVCSKEEIGDSKEFIGSKYISQCILVYFFTQDDHLMIHLNASPILPDIAAHIALFSSRGDVSVILVGGLDTTDRFKNACLDLLVMATESLASFGFNLIVTNAFLGGEKPLSEDFKLKFILDTIESRLKILCHQLYGYPLSDNIFSPEKEKKLFFNLKNLNSSANSSLYELKNTILRAMSVATLVFDAQSSQDMEQLRNMSNLKALFPEGNYLINLVEHTLFNKEVANSVVKSLPSYFELRDVVFSIKTRTAYIISDHLKTRYEAMRNVAIYIFRGYFLAYSSHVGYFQPKITRNFHKKVTPLFVDKKIKSKSAVLMAIDFPATFPNPEKIINNIYVYSTCASENFLVDAIQDNECAVPKIYPSFFNFFYKNELYVSPYIITINKILEKSFGYSTCITRKFPRKYGNNEVDIVIDTQNIEWANKVQGIFKKLNVPTSLILYGQQLQVWLLSSNTKTSSVYKILNRSWQTIELELELD